MSKKKKANEMVSDSHIPNGGHVPTTGWNYGLDGFDFDMDYGEGVEDGAALPEAYGMGGLPDGFVDPTADDDHEAGNVGRASAPLGKMMANPWGMSNMASEEDLKNAGNLADINWLDPSLGQDEERLPVNPVDKGIEQLEKAWGERTDGISIVPNRDKEIVDYQNKVRDPGQTTRLPGADKEVDWRKVAIRRAMRRSSYGENLQDILTELNDKSAARLVEADHGLAGRVFIRASAFPGMINGKWDKAIKRRCKSAAFILATPGTKMAALDRYLGKAVVTEVPWKKALGIYAPRLKAAGIKLPKGDARTVLKVAFTKAPTGKQTSRVATNLPTQAIKPMMNLADATQAINSAENTRQVIKKKSLKASLDERVANHVNDLVAKGRLTKAFGRGLLLSGKSPKSILEALTTELGKSASGTYEGTGVGATAHRAEKKPAQSTQTILSARLLSAQKSIDDLVARNMLSQDQADSILASGLEPNEMLTKAGQLAASAKTADYDGPVYSRAAGTRKVQKRTAHDLRIMEASKSSGIKAKEFRSLLRWARQQMSEGLAGQDLDMILKARFSGRLLKAAKILLAESRETHEGLSGHVYTDVEAYATSTGTQGCDNGARIHRANALKFALAMPRCGTCKFASTLPDGSKSCQKYNKKLADEAPVVDKAEYKRLALAQTEFTDQEHTASLFTANYDDSFGLGNENLTDFSFDETPSRDELTGFAFGGLVLGDDNE